VVIASTVVEAEGMSPDVETSEDVAHRRDVRAAVAGSTGMPRYVPRMPQHRVVAHPVVDRMSEQRMVADLTVAAVVANPMAAADAANQ
jgi:hypothetical protein